MGGTDGAEEKEGLQEKSTPPQDQIVAVIGEVGRWQLEKIAIVFLVSIPGLAHIFVSAFVFAKVDFWCADGLPDKTHANDSIKNVCPDTCTNFQFDHSTWKQTVISEFDLVCGRSSVPVIAKMIFFSGFAVGTFVAGIVSDMFGRKRSIALFSLLMATSGILTSFMPHYAAFVFLWWLVGIAAIANFTVAFVWVAELCTGKWKVILSMGMQLTWPCGRALAVGVSYNLTHWQTIFQVVSAPAVVLPFLLFFLPESPRWLLAKGRISEARAILIAGARRNGRQVNEEEVSLKQPTASSGKKGGLMDIMRYPTLRIKTLVMFFNWFSSSFMLYGIALNWQGLTGTLFISFLIAAILDVPGKLLALVACTWMGRRFPYIGLNCFAGLFFIINCFLPRGENIDKMPVVVISMISSFCVSASFSMLWMWTAELMPTHVRNSGVGTCSLLARLGGILSTTISILADISPVIPVALFAGFSLTSALLSLFLPETHGVPLPDTPEQSEEVHLVKGKKLLQFKIK